MKPTKLKPTQESPKLSNRDSLVTILISSQVLPLPLSAINRTLAWRYGPIQLGNSTATRGVQPVAVKSLHSTQSLCVGGNKLTKLLQPIVPHIISAASSRLVAPVSSRATSADARPALGPAAWRRTRWPTRQSDN